MRSLLTWLGFPPLRPSTGGATQSASYCYGVWLKHLTLLWKHGMRNMPQSVVELGPGNSLGTGFAALLSGAESYVGIDTAPLARADTNERVLRELIDLFHARAPRPTRGWPDFDDCLDERFFPSAILTPERLAAALAPGRLRTLPARARYCDARSAAPVPDGTADLILSHAVLQVVDDLDTLYARCMAWLKPGGWMSHQIDFASFGFGAEWNAHLRYSDLAWRLMRGRRPSCVNREPCSAHIALLRKHGFTAISLRRGLRYDGLPQEKLSARWRHAPHEDVQCGSAFVVARKPGGELRERVADLVERGRILDRCEIPGIAPLGERLDRAA